MQGRTAFILSNLNSLNIKLIHQFAKQNCNIILHGHSNEENRSRTIENEYRKDQIRFISHQLRIISDVDKLVEKAFNYFQHIDILIINHQYRRYYRASIEEFPIEKWKECIDYDLHTTFALVKTLWSQMKRQHFGRIIHIIDEENLLGNEYQSASTTSHHALFGLNRALSIEGKSYGITSNIIYPGLMQTNISEEFNHIKTLSDLVLFLCTDQARSINGQSISFDEKSLNYDVSSLALNIKE
ncbi:hypothetical protein I4U23_026153 [Adineta vaga]|nr:hypothetical protein I4U23_026153 [Adineta vaga]